MSDNERTGVRDLTYSRWHRANHMKQFVGHKAAWDCGVVDIDWCEYCRACNAPLALIETQHSSAPPKAARITTTLAKMAGLLAFSVSYTTDDTGEIVGFRVQRLAPTETDVEDMDPARYARWLVMLRTDHTCSSVEPPVSVGDAPGDDRGEVSADPAPRRLASVTSRNESTEES